MTYVSWYLSMLIAGTFAVSAWSKLHSRAAFGEFAVAVREMTGMRHRTALAAAAGVALGELAISVASVTGAARTGLGCAVLLLAAFTGLLIRTIAAGRRLRCNCFGMSSAPVSVRHVVRNVVLIATAATGFTLGSPYGHGHAAAAGLLLCGVAAAVPVAAIALLDDLAELFRVS